MASRPQGVPSRLVALHRLRFVQPDLKPDFALPAFQDVPDRDRP
jgi:hypothetical protein